MATSIVARESVAFGFSGIYQITCIANGKRYIGSSENCRTRLKRHFADLRRGDHANPNLQASFAKHGEGAFEIALLLRCAKSDLLMYEQICIDGLSPDFNVAPFAGAPNRGRRFPQETRDKVSRSLRGNSRTLGFKHTEETKQKLRGRVRGHSFQIGYEPTEETRKKLSETSKGRLHDDAAKQKVREAKLKWWADKRANDPAYMQRMSERMKGHTYNVGRKASPEACANISASLTGRKHSAETKAKQSASAKRRYGAEACIPDGQADLFEAGKK